MHICTHLQEGYERSQTFTKVREMAGEGFCLSPDLKKDPRKIPALAQAFMKGRYFM